MSNNDNPEQQQKDQEAQSNDPKVETKGPKVDAKYLLHPQRPPQFDQYPPQNGQYPPQNGQYPPQYGQYPPQNGQYPPQNGQYPPQNGQYPPQNGQYPPQNGQYPPQNGQYPPQNGQYPPQNGQYPPQGGQYPPQGGQYPPQNGQYPPQNGQYPPQNGQYPPQYGQYPPQNGQYPPPPGAGYQQPPANGPLVDGPCTYNRTHRTQIVQPFYSCITCGLVNDLGCCEACARVCHAGHQLVPKGNISCYCDCGEGSVRTCVRCKCRKVTASDAQMYNQYTQNAPECTYQRSGRRMIPQKLYTCVTCRLREGQCICETCARVCHYGHDVRPLAIPSGYCDCGAGELHTRCRCMNGASPGRPGMSQVGGPGVPVVGCNLQ
ncbi:hypothetical protein M9Y10_035460 [Tritrichomonas musculus]|uniref:UBR-type domain-containing protein n=1 Tax=Tritrichomonas musculus TaxID=1915356 RepID=A0ABR2KL06_9EUKA